MMSVYEDYNNRSIYVPLLCTLNITLSIRLLEIITILYLTILLSTPSILTTTDTN